MSAVERFDLEKITQIFQESLWDDDDIIMDEYLKGYEEINKFFGLLGSVFGFISSDVKTKINTLTKLRNGTDTEKYATIKTMISYERNANLLSGSRTLLRLHRGLEFVYEFLVRLAYLCENDKVHDSCKEAYESTLAKYHPWVVRQGALVAMYALPTQGELVKRMCCNADRILEILPEMLKNTKTVFDRTQDLYTLYEIHHL